VVATSDVPRVISHVYIFNACQRQYRHNSQYTNATDRQTDIWYIIPALFFSQSAVKTTTAYFGSIKFAPAIEQISRMCQFRTLRDKQNQRITSEVIHADISHCNRCINPAMGHSLYESKEKNVPHTYMSTTSPNSDRF